MVFPISWLHPHSTPSFFFLPQLKLSFEALDEVSDLFEQIKKKRTNQQPSKPLSDCSNLICPNTRVHSKLVLNMMVGTTCQILAEALIFAKKAGPDWKQMLEIISNSVVGSPLINYKAGPIRERNFKPAMTASMMAKDFDLVLTAGSQLGVAMPTIGLVQQFLGMMKATGRGELDFSGLILLMEELAGIKDPYKS